MVYANVCVCVCVCFHYEKKNQQWKIYWYIYMCVYIYNWHRWLLLNNHISKYNSFMLVLYRRYINYVSVCPPLFGTFICHCIYKEKNQQWITYSLIYIYIYIYIIYIYIYTVEPVYGGHSWDLTKVAAIERWPPYAGHM